MDKYYFFYGTGLALSHTNVLEKEKKRYNENVAEILL